MAGYSRQSVADIIANAIIKAAPINAELNAIRDAFAFSTGHKHDGSSNEGDYVPLIADPDAKNNVTVDTFNNRISVFVEVGGTSVEQLRIQDGAIVPVTDDAVDLGAVGAEFKNVYIDGIGYIDTVQVHENATIAGTLGVTGLSTLASVDVNAGTIDGTVIGATSAQAVTGTNITATTGFSGTLTGNVTGNLTGNSAGTHTGAVIGDVTGNVTSSGTSSFTNVNISGSLDMNSGTTATVTGLSSPVNGTDAATKTYVDNADALKLNLSGGTMSGAIAMGTNKITGLGTPTSTADAATKGYVDTSISNLVDAAPGALDTLNELAAAIGDDANFATTVTNSIATKLPLAGGTMTGDIALGSNKATSTATPTTADTLTRKGYVDTQDALKLSLTGGTMSGAIAMGTSKITGMGNPTSAQDAATKTYVDTADALKLSLTGGTMTGAISMGANKVTSSATPTTDDDLTRKAYVDSILGSATSAAASAAAALVSETNASGSASAASSSASNASASAASAASVYDQFDDRYLGSKSSEPSVDNDGDPLLTGALYFNSTTEKLRIYTGSLWQDAGSSVNGTANRVVYTPDADTTTFNIVYDIGYVDVYLNGVKLVAGSDYTATDGTTVVLTTGTLAGDTVDIIAYGTFTLISVYERDEADTTFAKLTGAAFSGDSSVTTNSSSDAFRITQTGTGNALLVEDADSTSFVVSADGRVGVGYTPTTAQFGVSSTGTDPWDYITVRNTTSGEYTGIGFDGNDTTSNFIISRFNTGGHNIAIGDTGHVYLNPDQDNVGIGLPTDTVPATRLHVVGNSLVEGIDAAASSGPIFYLRRTSASPAVDDYLGEIKFQGTNDAADNGVSYARIIAQALDVTAGSEDGSLTFWTTRNGTSSVKMELINTGTLSLNGGGNTPGGSSLNTLGILYLYRDSTSATSFAQTITSDWGAVGREVYRVRTDGNVLNYNNSYGALSDAKLKENVADATPKLEDLCKLRVVNFNYIGDENKQLGLIAQEVEQVFPKLVDENHDADADGNETGEVTKSVKYSILVPMLVKALQEQQDMISALEARVSALEAK